MQEIITRLKSWAQGNRAPPFIIDINPTDYCNLKCISCWQRNKKFEGKLDSKLYEVSDERYLPLLDEAKELGIKRWEITGGGEPLIRKNLVMKLTSLIKKKGMGGNITTNGTLFSHEAIRHLVRVNWDMVTFSIDGPNHEIHNYLRGSPHAFERAVTALKLFNEEKAIQNKRKPQIAFNAVLSNKNHTALSQMIMMAKKYACTSIKFEPITIHSHAGGSLILSEENMLELKKCIPKAIKLANKYKIQTNLCHLMDTKLIEKSNYINTVIQNDKKHFSCYEPWYHIVIKVDGTAGPCCIYDKKKLNIKNKTLKEIWFSGYFNSIRSDISHNKMPDFCRICNAGQIIQNRAIRELTDEYA
jgi:MoaA/NifB/PqqE/SkfB family radical SAM enzyme